MLKKETQPDGSYLVYTYDVAHRLVEIADGNGNRTAYILDANGNRTQENSYDPHGVLHATRNRIFNALNQLQQDIGAASVGSPVTAYSYDAAGSRTAVDAPMGRHASNEFDELGRLKHATDALLGVTSYSYNQRSNVTSVTDPNGRTTNYAYTGFGDVLSQDSPDTGLTSNTFDTAGNLKTNSDARGVVATQTYDALNRISAVNYSQNGVLLQAISYSYDSAANGIGKIAAVSDSNHSISWSYDSWGRVASKTQTVGALVRTVQYQYQNGHLHSLTLPSGNVVTYEVNLNGEVISVQVGTTTILSAVTYEPFGSINGWVWGNGSGFGRAFREDGRLASVSSDNTGIGNLAFTYDLASRITAVDRSNSAPNSWALAYDNLDRLTSATTSTRNLSWSYDAIGNRLTQVGYQEASYPAEGMSFSFDPRGRMGSVTVGSSTTSYVYNALGQRVRKAAGASTPINFVYDEVGHLVGEYTDGGVLIQETVWLQDMPVATIRPSASGSVDVFYVHSDHLGAPRAVTRPTDNAVLWQWRADPFGTDAPDQNPAGQGTFAYSLRFPGQYADAESGLNYNYFRDYDPIIGRYVESDPIGLRGGYNTYAYVGDNPEGGIDPRGLIAYWPPDNSGQAGHPMCDGNGDIVIQQSTITPDEQRCGITRCQIRHEAVHKGDLIRTYPAPCVGQPRGVIPGFDLPSQANASEARAWDNSVQCLADKYRRATQCSGCKPIIKRWLDFAVQKRAQYGK
jgi:RHS repeat-associated protein